MALDYKDRTDFDDAERGFIAALSPAVITMANGKVIWDGDAYGFLTANARPPRTRACGGRGNSATSRAFSRSPTASTRCATSICRI